MLALRQFIVENVVTCYPDEGRLALNATTLDHAR